MCCHSDLEPVGTKLVLSVAVCIGYTSADDEQGIDRGITDEILWPFFFVWLPGGG